MSKTKTNKIAKAIRISIYSTFLAGAITATGAQAANVNFDVTETSSSTPVYGKTLPPIGHVNFCARHGSECKSLGGTTRKVVLNNDNWKILHEVNNYSNKSIVPVTDGELYNVPEHWTFPTNAGDCEDIVLQKKRYLEGLGFPAETLLITVVLDEMGLGHAVLTVRTDRGDLVLDNMRDDIRTWNATGYTFIKRQSQYNPRLWVSLTKRGVRVSHTTAAGKD